LAGFAKSGQIQTPAPNSCTTLIKTGAIKNLQYTLDEQQKGKITMQTQVNDAGIELSQAHPSVPWHPC
jgi:hypothetical protein